MALSVLTPQRVWTNELKQNGYTDGLQTIPVVDYSTTLSATTSAPVDSMRYLTSSSTSNGSASGGAATRGMTTTLGTIQMYNTYLVKFVALLCISLTV
jgi:hypothetical protein